ncbi:MAG TPA: PepSY-associated TM helix domain-containing protein [Opitutaceae bacterium]|nr:PepSY-associated TM helix domain-containing protein [Opitutaceae bacterium]
MSAGLRKTIFQLHMVAGLILGAFLLVASLSGTILAFRSEIDVYFNRPLLRVTPGERTQPIDYLVAQARQAYPKTRVEYVEFIGEADSAAIVRFGGSLHPEVFLNPYTGEVTGERDRDDSFVYIVEKIHRYLFWDKKGAVITGSVSLALLFMLASGVYLWMPKSWSKLRDALIVNRRFKGRAWTVNLHKVLGLYGSTVLFLSVVTGVPIAFKWFRDTVFYTTTGSAQPAPPPKVTTTGTKVPLEKIWAAAHTFVPNFRIARMTLPRAKDDPFSIYFVAMDAPHTNALSYVYVDPVSGNVLRYAPYEKESFGHRLYLLSLPLHVGEVGGLLGRLITVAGALTLTVLVVTGTWLYYRRKINPMRRIPSSSSIPADSKVVS